MIPLMLVRGRGQLAVSQAGLVATILHLFVSTAIAGGLMLKLGLGMPFVYWLLAFYFTSLVIVVIASVQAVKKSPVTAGQALGT